MARIFRNSNEFRSTIRRRFLSSQSPFYISTPIYYVNDKPHIGHAYTSVACDVLARWKRLEHRDVLFVTGTDEHGQKVQESAEAAGVTPQEYVDRVSESFRAMLRTMNCSEDAFIRTTDAKHRECVTALWKQLEENGHLYMADYEGWYSVRDEMFYLESELVNGKAPTGSPVQWIAKERSYFFRLSNFQQELLDHYAKHPNFIAPEARRNEVLSFVKKGLRDLSVSRTTFDWGIPVPGADGHVMYVWVDALANYLSVLDWPKNQPLFDKFWPHSFHMLGKDILRFHAVYWPALLLAVGVSPPQRMFAHGWWTKDGQKMSKSVGNIIDPHDLVTKYGVDQVRFFMFSEVSFGEDGDFSETSFLKCANGFLANAYGNLHNRVQAMVHKNIGYVPEVGEDRLTVTDRQLLESAAQLYSEMEPLIERAAMNSACGVLSTFVRSLNKYMDETAPWTLKKTDPERMETVLWVLMGVPQARCYLLNAIHASCILQYSLPALCTGRPKDL